MQDSAPDRTRQCFLSLFGNGESRISKWMGVYVTAVRMLAYSFQQEPRQRNV
jgi:hypothetical protein